MRSWSNDRACSSTSEPKPTEKSGGTRTWPRRAWTAFDRVAQRNLDLGVDARDALHVLALNLHRAGLAADGQHVLRRHDLAARRAEQHVADVGDLLAVGLAQPDDHRVLVAALAELRRRRAGDVRLDRRGDALHRHAEHRRLRPVDADGDLGAAFLAADADVGDAGRVFHHLARVLGDAPRVVEVVAADLELQAAGLAVVVLCRRR